MKPLLGKSILIVDDEEGLREILTDELRYAGAEVTTADSGNAAFELVRTRAFDAVLTDVIMTDGDGPSLIARINAGAGPKPKLFLCTGFSDLTKAEIDRLNVTAVFEKPFEREHLVRTMAEALRGHPVP